MYCVSCLLIIFMWGCTNQSFHCHPSPYNTASTPIRYIDEMEESPNDTDMISFILHNPKNFKTLLSPVWIWCITIGPFSSILFWLMGSHSRAVWGLNSRLRKRLSWVGQGAFIVSLYCLEILVKLTDLTMTHFSSSCQSDLFYMFLSHSFTFKLTLCEWTWN